MSFELLREVCFERYASRWFAIIPWCNRDYNTVCCYCCLVLYLLWYLCLLINWLNIQFINKVYKYCNKNNNKKHNNSNRSSKFSYNFVFIVLYNTGWFYPRSYLPYCCQKIVMNSGESFLHGSVSDLPMAMTIIGFTKNRGCCCCCCNLFTKNWCICCN